MKQLAGGLFRGLRAGLATIGLAMLIIVFRDHPTGLLPGRYITLKDVHGRQWTIQPRLIRAITPEFTRDDQVKIWLEDGQQITAPKEVRAEIERGTQWVGNKDFRSSEH